MRPVQQLARVSLQDKRVSDLRGVLVFSCPFVCAAFTTRFSYHHPVPSPPHPSQRQTSLFCDIPQNTELIGILRSNKHLNLSTRLAQSINQQQSLNEYYEHTVWAYNINIYAIRYHSRTDSIQSSTFQPLIPSFIHLSSINTHLYYLCKFCLPMAVWKSQ